MTSRTHIGAFCATNRHLSIGVPNYCWLPVPMDMLPLLSCLNLVIFQKSTHCRASGTQTRLWSKSVNSPTSNLTLRTFARAVSKITLFPDVDVLCAVTKATSSCVHRTYAAGPCSIYNKHKMQIAFFQTAITRSSCDVSVHQTPVVFSAISSRLNLSIGDDGLGNVPCLCRCMTNLSPFSQTQAFKHELRTLMWLVSDSQTHLVSIDVRFLESRITTVRIDTIDARSAQSACAHTSTLLHRRTGKFSLAQQCVSNVVLFASSHNKRHILLSTSQSVAHNDYCQVILTASQELKRNRAPPPCSLEFLELKQPVLCWWLVLRDPPPTVGRF